MNSEAISIATQSAMERTAPQAAGLLRVSDVAATAIGLAPALIVAVQT